MKNRMFLRLFVLMGLCVLGSSCGQEKQVEYAKDSTLETPAPAALSRQKFRFNTQLVRSNGLSLADASAFTMTLSNCASSQSATVTEANVYLELYEFDRNCIVKLTQFTLNSKVYTPKAGSLFTTWAVGNKAVFTSPTPGDELNVEVITTVASPVVANGTVQYQFSEITQGADNTIGEAVVRQSAILTVNGQAAPNFTINQIKLVGITAAGNAEFQFQLHCANSVVGTGNAMQCDDVLMRDIYMVLVEDTYGGVLTQANMDTIYGAAPGGGVQIDTATEVITPGAGTPVLARGGFVTANTGDADVMVMAGTKPVDSHPNMLLVLKAGPGYLYFNVDVTTITQDGSH